MNKKALKMWTKVISSPKPQRKPGDKAIIYDDPITCEKREGIATLVEKIKEDKLKEFWLVRFEDGMEVTRWVAKIL